MNIIVNNLSELEKLNEKESFSAVYDLDLTCHHATKTFNRLTGTDRYKYGAKGLNSHTLPCSSSFATSEAAAFFEADAAQLFKDKNRELLLFLLNWLTTKFITLFMVCM
jgi:hypothetical protein